MNFRLLIFVLCSLGISKESFSQDLRFIDKDEYHQILMNIQSFVAYDYFSNDSISHNLNEFTNHILPYVKCEEYLAFYTKPFDTLISSTNDTFRIFELVFDNYSVQEKNSEIRSVPNLRYFYNKPVRNALIAKSTNLNRLYFLSGYFFLDDCSFLFKSSLDNWNKKSASNYIPLRFHNLEPEIKKIHNDRIVFYSKFKNELYQVRYESIDILEKIKE